MTGVFLVLIGAAGFFGWRSLKRDAEARRFERWLADQDRRTLAAGVDGVLWNWDWLVAEQKRRGRI